MATLPIASSFGVDGRYQPFTRSNIAQAPRWANMPPELQEAVLTVSAVLPFRTNAYVMDHLIDWARVPDDPMYQLTFPQRDMLSPEDYRTMRDLVVGGASRDTLEQAASAIRLRLNPHPAGQMTHNVPRLGDRRIDGLQHKYRETVLFFPSPGQTCHAYCTFCFRWPQFVGMPGLKFASREVGDLVAYVRAHPDVTDVLLTGGDPMIMSAKHLRAYIEPLLDLDQLVSIRIGTKSVGYWPQRYVTDGDADDVLRLFERVVASGKQLALMGHFSHPVELSTSIAQEAVRRIRNTGANIRMQSPCIRYVNDEPDAWAELWRSGVRLGCIPYYMFVERDTGARNYFALPLVQVWNIFRLAYQQVSGLARTVRGPSMSAMPGKIHVLGVSNVGGQRAFMLEFLQARRPELVRRPFFARFDPTAIWFDQLEPLTDADRPFFQSAPPSSAA